MSFLPIAERELRTAARRPGAYRGRVRAALGAMAIAAWAAYFQQHLPAAQLGSMLFSLLSGIVFLMALMAGAGFTADTISAERREGTLGLLFLTDLKSWDVLAGKLAVSSLGGLYGIVAMMPVLAIPLLLGGVTGAEYARMMFTVLNTLFWSLSIGLLVSTFQTDSRTATSQTFACLLAGAGLGPALGFVISLWLQSRGMPESVIQWYVVPLLCLSPGAAFVGGFDAAYRLLSLQYLAANGLVLISSGLFLFAAGRRLPGCWQNEIALGSVSKPAGTLHVDAAAGVITTMTRTRMLESSPFVWLVCRRRWRRAMPWLFLLIVSLTYVGLGIWAGSDWWAPESYLGFSILLHLIFKLWIAGEAPRQIFDDRKSGAMELLLTMPVTDRGFVIGHVKALRRLFLGPLVAIGAVDILLILLTADYGQSSETRAEWLLMWAMRLWFLAVDVLALMVLGLWHGASTHRPRVHATPFIVVIILPWLMIGVLATAVYSPMQGPDPLSFTDKLWIWWFIGTLTAGFSGVWNWRSLTRHFRTVTATRPGAKRVVTIPV